MNAQYEGKDKIDMGAHNYYKIYDDNKSENDYNTYKYNSDYN